MKTYSAGTKTPLPAFPIGKIEGVRIFNKDNEEEYLDTTPEFIASNNLNEPGYIVIFPSGKYVALSTEDFESMYDPVVEEVNLESAKETPVKTSKEKKAPAGQTRGSMPTKVSQW